MRIVAALILSLIAYIVLFFVIIKQPLTTGLTNAYYVKKIGYARSIKGPKIVLFAGSNGLFSHRCETIEKVSGIPCVNASLHAGLAIDVALQSLKNFVRSGDTVLMPLEYDQYAQSDRNMVRNVATNTYLVSYHPGWLLRLSPERIVFAMFSFDIRYLLSATTETLLSSLGVERRYTIDTLTANGDMKGHTAEKGLEYREYISGLPSPLPDEHYFTQNTFDGEREIGKFLRWAKGNDVAVIGLLPTVFDDVPVPQAIIDKLRLLFENEGQYFLSMPGNSQYARSHFYDTHYHLNEETQIEHSRTIAERLMPLMRSLHRHPESLQK